MRNYPDDAVTMPEKMLFSPVAAAEARMGSQLLWVGYDAYMMHDGLLTS
jgi:hypothetical protein